MHGPSPTSNFWGDRPPVPLGLAPVCCCTWLEQGARARWRAQGPVDPMIRPCECTTSIILDPLSSPLLPSMSVQLVYMSSFILSIYASQSAWICLGFSHRQPTYESCMQCINAELGQTDILSTCPNHRNLLWTSLSSKVVWLSNVCLMSSLLIFYSLVNPAILRSEHISAVRILFSSCFRIAQHSNTYRKIGCIIVSWFIMVLFVNSSLLFHILVIIPNACDVRPILLCMSFSLLSSAFASPPRQTNSSTCSIPPSPWILLLRGVSFLLDLPQFWLFLCVDHQENFILVSIFCQSVS